MDFPFKSGTLSEMTWSKAHCLCNDPNAFELQQNIAISEALPAVHKIV